MPPCPLRADDAGVRPRWPRCRPCWASFRPSSRRCPRLPLPGAWAEARDLLFSDTALDAKTKSLISLAVAAQIPCTYCIFDDTNGARRAGATDEEIKEAIAVAALTRHWSTIFNGNQVDLDTYKKEMGGM